MSNKIKVLAVLVNYGDEQINYLEQVVKELKKFKKYEVTVIVNSSINLNIREIDNVNIYKLDNYQLLPLTCRATIWEYRNEYDIFIYGENDHLFKEKHLDNHILYSNILPKNRISGLIQYEEDLDCIYYPSYHAEFDWDFNSIEVYNGKYFAHFTNLHQATFILTKEQLLRVGKKFNFEELVTKNSIWYKVYRKVRKKLGLKLERVYSLKCKVNTDVFQFGGMKKMICITDFEDNLIHHLPNLYIHGNNGRVKLHSDSVRMEHSLKKILDKSNN